MCIRFHWIEALEAHLSASALGEGPAHSTPGLSAIEACGGGDYFHEF